MHCGRWVAGNDGRETGCEACGCAVCPRLLQPCFERYGEKNKGVRGGAGKAPEIVGFLRGKAGRLHVLEVGGWRTRVVENPPMRAGYIGPAVVEVADKGVEDDHQADDGHEMEPATSPHEEEKEEVDHNDDAESDESGTSRSSSSSGSSESVTAGSSSIHADRSSEGEQVMAWLNAYSEAMTKLSALHASRTAGV